MIKVTKETPKHYINEFNSGIANVVPFANNNSCNRLIMFNSMGFSHKVPVMDGDYPLVTTPHAFEILRSTENRVSKNEMRVLKRIRKQICGKDTSEYAVIFLNENGELDIIIESEYSATHDNYGFKIINKMMTDDVIPPETLWRRTSSYDENGVPLMFNNLKTIYVTSEEVLEDAVYLTNSGMKKMKCLKHQTPQITITPNRILKNIYGDFTCECGYTESNQSHNNRCPKCGKIMKESYKPFPLIGEHVNDKNLLLSLSAPKTNFIMSNDSLRRVVNGDQTLICDGIVTNITVYSPYNKQLPNEFLNNIKLGQDTFIYEIYSNMMDLSNQYDKMSIKFINTLELYTSIVTPVGPKTTEGAAYRFGNDVLNREDVHIVFEITKEKAITDLGQKVANCYGGKGVVSVLGDKFIGETDPLAIVPINGDVKDEYGNEIDALVAVVGVVNRANWGQMHEHFVTSIMDDILRHYNNGNRDINILIDVSKFINEDTSNYYKDLYERIGLEEMIKVFNDYKGIPVFVPAFTSGFNMQSVKDIVDTLHKYKVKTGPRRIFMGGIELSSKFEVGTTSYMRLKQSTDSKFSVRTEGLMSSKGTFSKSTKKKNYHSLSNDTPMKISALSVDKIVNIMSNGDLSIFFKTGSESIETMQAYLAGMGLEIKKEDK